MPDNHPAPATPAPDPGRRPPSAEPSGEEDPGAALDDPAMLEAMREEARRSGTAGPAGPATPEHQKPPTTPAG